MSAPASESWARSIAYSVIVESRLIRYDRMTSAAPMMAPYMRMRKRSVSSESSQTMTKAESAMHMKTANATARSLTARARKNSGMM